jgi:peroxiredoxin
MNSLHPAVAAIGLAILIALPTLADTAASASRPMLGAGVMAPEFSSFDLAGQEVKLADYRGKVLILDFWATWCSPCIASMPHTQEIAAKYADQGVVVLAVCTGDKRSKFEDWVKLKAKSYPALRFTFDPHESGTPAHEQRASVALYGVPAIPAQFILDRAGRIVATTNGYVSGDTRLEAALARAGVKVDPAIVALAAGTEAKIAAARVQTPAPTPQARTAPPPFTEDAVKLKAGATMTDLAMRAADGSPQKVSDFRGRPLVISFSPADMARTACGCSRSSPAIHPRTTAPGWICTAAGTGSRRRSIPLGLWR